MAGGECCDDGGRIILRKVRLDAEFSYSVLAGPIHTVSWTQSTWPDAQSIPVHRAWPIHKVPRVHTESPKHKASQTNTTLPHFAFGFRMTTTPLSCSCQPTPLLISSSHLASVDRSTNTLSAFR
jgi:hypothetical protein